MTVVYKRWWIVPYRKTPNAIAITSYQGGHVEYFKYMYDLLKERGCSHIKIFGGGGGVNTAI